MIKKLLFGLFLIPVVGISQNNRLAEIRDKQMASESQPHNVAQSVQDVCDAVAVPYSENFESAIVPAMPECTTIENAGGGNNFETALTTGYGFSSQTLRYKWNTSSPADAWFFTTGIQMEANRSYSISYRYGSAGATAFTEKLKVHIGNSATVAGMQAEPLIDHPLVNNNAQPITDNLTFTAPTDSVYYIGFNCYSDTDQFYLFVDDILVDVSLATNDLSQVFFKCFPNPATEMLTITSKQVIDNVQIHNMLGQVVFSSRVNATDIQIDMRNFPSGTYVVQAGSGTVTETTKILKN